MEVGKFHGNQWSGSNDPDQYTSIKQAAELMQVSEPTVKRAKKRMRDNPQAHEAAKRGEKPEKTMTSAPRK